MLIKYISRTKLLGLLFFTAFGAILELVGLAMFVPLLLLLLEDDGIAKSEYLGRIYEKLDIGSHGTFLVLICGAVFLFTILKNLLLHKINNHRNRALLKLFSTYSTTLFTSYYKKGLQFIKENSTTTLSHNTNSVCYSYVFGFLSPFFTLAGDLLLVVLIITSLAFVNIYIAALEVILFLPLILFYQIMIVEKLQRAGKADNEAKKNQWKITMETFRGYAEVEVNNVFPKLMGIFRNGLKAISEAKERTENLKSIASKSIEIGVILVITGVVVTYYFIEKEGGSFRVLIGLFAIATLKLMPTIRSVVNQYSSIKSNLFTKEVLVEINADEKYVSPTNEKITQVTFQFEHKIEFRNVSFGFSGRSQIIDNLSMTIQKGEKLGIKGISGSGKSTFLNLLLGLYEPTEGGVYIDDVLLNLSNDAEWHKRVAYVSQDIFIMDTTLEENIVLEDSIDYVRLNKAVEGASLKELTDSLPLGLANRIGEGGCRLSGGERQRVAIARALYKRADVIMLDEPTSSLDKQTESVITETLKNPAFRKNDMTLLIISHRESMLDICDRVIDLSE